MRKINILIAGATGYIGVQLVKLLVKHKNINIKYLCGNSSIGKKISFFDSEIILGVFKPPKRFLFSVSTLLKIILLLQK